MHAMPEDYRSIGDQAPREKKARKVANFAQEMKNRGGNPRPSRNGKRVCLSRSYEERVMAIPVPMNVEERDAPQKTRFAQWRAEKRIPRGKQMSAEWHRCNRASKKTSGLPYRTHGGQTSKECRLRYRVNKAAKQHLGLEIDTHKDFERLQSYIRRSWTYVKPEFKGQLLQRWQQSFP